MRTTILAPAALLLALSSCGPHTAPTPVMVAATPTPQSVVADLIASDRQFAEAAATAPGVSGMSAMFASDTMMMGVPEPGFAVGSAETAARIAKIAGDSANGATVQWNPVRAGISADGEQGFTLGYLQLTKDGAATFQAKYLSYWVKGSEGWRVRLYKLVPRETAPIPAASFSPLIPPAILPHGSGPTSSAASLAAAEKAFSDAAQTAGLRENFQKLGRPDSMHTLASNDLLLSNIAIGEAHPDGPSPLNWKADDVVIASSGDLGATYGYLLRNGPTPPGRLPKIPFFTIWYRESPDSPWRYVAE